MTYSIFVNAGISVTHCNGTSNRSPECRVCGSWINHWENYRQYAFGKCCLCNNGKKEVGAHIKIESKNGEWIIPTCKSCNSQGGSHKLLYDIYAVSAIQCPENVLNRQ